MLREKAVFFLEKTLILIFCIFFIVAPYETKCAGRVSFVAGLIGWFLLNIIDNRRRFLRSFIPRSPLNKPIFAFMGACILSAVFSLNFYHSQAILFDRYLMYFVIFFIGTWLSARNPRNLYFLAGAFAVSAMVFGAGGVYDYIYYRFFLRNLAMSERLWSVFHIRIPYYGFPFFLVYFTPFSFLVFLLGKRRWIKGVALLVFGLLFLCLLWNASRAAWLSIFLALALMVFLVIKSKRALVLSIVVLLAILIFFVPTARKRIETTANPAKWSNRLELYGSAFAIFRDRPLFGSGIAMYEKLISTPKYALPADYPVAKQLNLHAHNTYLELAADMGSLGVFAFIWIFAVFLRNITVEATNFYKDGRDNLRMVSLGMASSIVAVLIFAFSTTIITVGVNNSIYFWFLFGIVSGFLSSSAQKKA